eukprot:m.116072 g.116072  ORF g.116072 m.116072 type:complete len:103 (+) comp10901_c0_seq2:161-469(+)
MPIGRNVPRRLASKSQRLIPSPGDSDSELSTEGVVIAMPRGLQIRANGITDDDEPLFPIHHVAGTPSGCRKLTVTACVMLSLLTVFVVAVTYLQHAFGDSDS